MVGIRKSHLQEHLFIVDIHDLNTVTQYPSTEGLRVWSHTVIRIEYAHIITAGIGNAEYNVAIHYYIQYL